MTGYDMLNIAKRHVVGLERTGASGQYVGRCPLHGEATPSLVVERSEFHCLSCGARGGPAEFLAFLMERRLYGDFAK